MINELLPCPFCDGRAEFAKEYDLDKYGEDLEYKIVRCYDCGARTERCMEFEEAATEWNNRVE